MDLRGWLIATAYMFVLREKAGTLSQVGSWPPSDREKL